MVFSFDGSPADPGCAGLVIVNGTCHNTNVTGNQLILDMSYNPNSCVEVTVDGVTVSVLTHRGNVVTDESVNVVDLQAVKDQVFGPLDDSNFACDLNVDGQIDVMDLQLVSDNVFTPASCD